MRLTDFIFCEFAFLDQYHRLCAIGITPEIVVRALPIGVPRGTIVARIQRENDTNARKVTVGLKMSVNGKGAQPTSTEGIQFIQERDHIFVVLRSFAIHVPGIYEFEVLIDGKAVGKLRLPVRVATSG